MDAVPTPPPGQTNKLSSPGGRDLSSPGGGIWGLVGWMGGGESHLVAVRHVDVILLVLVEGTQELL